MLRSLAEGLRVVTVLLHPYMPETTERLLGALGAGRRLRDRRRRASARPARAPSRTLDPPLFPKQPCQAA